ncbi:MAG: type I CRISPR-associated protein Cas7 [Bacteroidia bacterium]
MSQFNNRVYGCAIIKAINSNYNADFSGQPRTLPNGDIYATDKALKYTIRYFLKHVQNEPVLYFKRLTKESITLDLIGLYNELFSADVKKDKKEVVLKNLLSATDVRLFGATFAPKGAGDSKNISIHGPVQITHAKNKFTDGTIYTEQIMAPFASPGKDGDAEAKKGNTTLGTQSKLDEGHYVHHFSVNPQNIADHAERAEVDGLSEKDMDLLKEGLRKGATFYDSAAKAGTENELLLWVQLKEDSKAVMPSFVDLVEVGEDRKIDLAKIKDLLAQDHLKNEIEKVELYYQKNATEIINAPEKAEHLAI